MANYDRSRRKIIYEVLEPRVLLSADLPLDLAPLPIQNTTLLLDSSGEPAPTKASYSIASMNQVQAMSVGFTPESQPKTIPGLADMSLIAERVLGGLGTFADTLNDLLGEVDVAGFDQGELSGFEDFIDNIKNLDANQLAWTEAGNIDAAAEALADALNTALSSSLDSSVSVTGLYDGITRELKFNIQLNSSLSSEGELADLSEKSLITDINSKMGALVDSDLFNTLILDAPDSLGLAGDLTANYFVDAKLNIDANIGVRLADALSGASFDDSALKNTDSFVEAEAVNLNVLVGLKQVNTDLALADDTITVSTENAGFSLSTDISAELKSNEGATRINGSSGDDIQFTVKGGFSASVPITTSVSGLTGISGVLGTPVINIDLAEGEEPSGIALDFTWILY